MINWDVILVKKKWRVVLEIYYFCGIWYNFIFIVLFLLYEVFGGSVRFG